MRALIGMILTLVLLQTGEAATPWPNEPEGSSVQMDCPFAGNVCGMKDVYNSASFATDAATPTQDGRVLDSYLAANSSTGNGVWAYYLPRNTREVYAGTWWKTNPEFEGVSVSTNKLFYITGNDNNNILAWRGGQDQPKQLVFYTQQTTMNNCHIPSYYSPGCVNSSDGPGSGWFNPNGPSSGVVSAGSGWHRLEFYLKASTTKDSKDGIIRTWLDGVLVGSYSGANIYPDGIASVEINQAWDGVIPCYDPRAPRDCGRAWHHYFDHLRISIPSGALPPFLITTTSIPSAASGKPYAAYLKAEGGKAPYSWVISEGSLHPGLSLNSSTGVISGTPTTGGKCSFTVKALDANVPPVSATKSYSIVASGPSAVSDKPTTTVNGLRLTAEPRGGSVRFHLPGQGRSLLSVYDLSGREVWRHVGSGAAVWNHGGKLKKGLYLVRSVQNGKTLNTSYCHIW